MSHAHTAQYLVVVDKQNNPLALLDREQTLRQGLLHREVILLLTDQRGRIILRKRSQREALYPGRWDCVGSADVPLQSGAEDMAWSLLPPGLILKKISLHHVIRLAASPQTGNAFVEIFYGQVPNDMTSELLHDLTFLAADRDELHALVTSFPDQLTPTLILAWSTLEPLMTSTNR